MLCRIHKICWLSLVVLLFLNACSNESPAPSAEAPGDAPTATAPSPSPVEEAASEVVREFPRESRESLPEEMPLPMPEPEYAPAAAAPPPSRLDAEDLWESFSRGEAEEVSPGAGDAPALDDEDFDFDRSLAEETAPMSAPERVGDLSGAAEAGSVQTGTPHDDVAAPLPAPKPSVDEKPFRDEGSHHLVEVFYATDRKQTGSSAPAEKFGPERGLLSYGSCEVSIPKGHSPGELEAPRWWRLEFSEDPARHVVLLRADVTSVDDFFVRVSERALGSPDKNAFVFVHGYNVTFEDAARRTAQITFDLRFRGAPVFYSWPSQGETGKYTIDEQNIEWTESNLKRFLSAFFDRSGAENIYLVAHSMGNRGLTRALRALVSEKPEIRQRLREIILTAPDIDAEVFQRDIAPALTAFERPVTLYASSEDVALKASKKVHGHPRAGDSGDQIVIVPGIETVDATGTDTSFLRHSYFAEVESVLTDIFDLIRHRTRADQRERLEPIDTPQGRYWAFRN